MGVYYKTKNGILYHGNNIQVMKELFDKKQMVDCVITSPPYDNLRQYDAMFDFESTAETLAQIIDKGRIIVWVVGDSTKNGNESGNSFRQALYFRDKCGLNLHDTMIYHKEIPTWNPSCKRYKQQIEYMFIFSKGRVSVFNPIEDVPVKNMSPRICKANRNGKNPRYEMYVPKKDKTCRGNIWKYAVGSGSATDKVAFQHPAIFPEKLVHDHIISWSNPGELILDPFMGSGTTAIECERLGRKWIGIEVSKKYCGIVVERLENMKKDKKTITKKKDD